MKIIFYYCIWLILLHDNKMLYRMDLINFYTASPHLQANNLSGEKYTSEWKKEMQIDLIGTYRFFFSFYFFMRSQFSEIYEDSSSCCLLSLVPLIWEQIKLP